MPHTGSKPMPPSLLRSPLLPGLSVAAWWFSLAVLGSRTYFLMPYAAKTLLTPDLEPFGASATWLLMTLVLAAVWGRLAYWRGYTLRACLYLLIASLPTALWMLRTGGLLASSPWFIEIIWLAGWTGLSFGELAINLGQRPTPETSKTIKARDVWSSVLLLVLLCLGTGWWFYQAWWYHHSFLFGFNDYGHFLQRVANTVSGRGVLLETPVLPAFWDHFNPGLLLLVPLWTAWPDVQQAFLWQALALAGSSYLIYRIGMRLELSRPAAAIYGIAWLVQPVLGQMNLAYTYGWHPITLAIPLLLACCWALLANHRWLALICCLVALSMEEGVFVVVSLTAFCCGAIRWLSDRQMLPANSSSDRDLLAKFSRSLPLSSWLSTWALAAIAFVLVYKFSGLAEFQTGRFVALGSNLTEVMLSPILRPTAFWGSLLSWDRWYFVMLLWLPCGSMALARGWPYLLPTILPLGVLMVWDHAPAHSITFQYASTLLPLFWLSAMVGAGALGRRSAGIDFKHAISALATGLMLSLFVGQLPISLPTLMDVDGRTYGDSSSMRRRVTDEDGRWLAEQIQELRQSNPRCLTTGRIAAHLVGMPDIETVGQYIERRPKLSRLPDRLDQPMVHYDVIMLDRQEGFQQSREQIDAVEAEARAAGFIETSTKFDIVILKRPT